MRCEMDGRGYLRLLGMTEEEREEVERGVAELCGAEHEQARTTGNRLREALAEGGIKWPLLASLSRWCYTEGARKSGVEGARRVSRAVFGGEILPRLATDEWRRDIETSAARGAMRAFLDDLERRGARSTGIADRAVEVGAVPVTDGGMPTGQGRLETAGSAGSHRRAECLGRGGVAQRGSRACLQRWMRERPVELADRILASSLSLSLAPAAGLEWKSPLPAEDYYEYRDDFLVPLGLEHHEAAVRRFWPARGPQWDGLGLLRLAEGKGVLLVEAKAYPREAVSDCEAHDPASLAQIDAAFRRVQSFMGVEPANWKEAAYQLANRLAFLYLLNEELQVPTWLAVIHFVNDRSHRPTSLAEWRRSFVAPFRTLGLRGDCALLDHVIPVFLEAVPSAGPSSYGDF